MSGSFSCRSRTRSARSADALPSARGTGSRAGERTRQRRVRSANLEAVVPPWAAVVFPSPEPVLVFDGGCPFCRHFAELSELRSGIPGLRIRDGREEVELRRDLASRGFPLRDGAVLLLGERVLHGAEAIQWICARMRPGAPLLRLLAPLLATPARARSAYPLLLLARRVALGLRGLPVDPDGAPAGFIERRLRPAPVLPNRSECPEE